MSECTREGERNPSRPSGEDGAPEDVANCCMKFPRSLADQTSSFLCAWTATGAPLYTSEKLRLRSHYAEMNGVGAVLRIDGTVCQHGPA